MLSKGVVVVCSSICDRAPLTRLIEVNRRVRWRKDGIGSTNYRAHLSRHVYNSSVGSALVTTRIEIDELRTSVHVADKGLPYKAVDEVGSQVLPCSSLRAQAHQGLSTLAGCASDVAFALEGVWIVGHQVH